MCGNFGHQIDTYLRDLKITHLQSFGYQVDPAIIGEKFGGRVVMSGNISPMVIFEGPPSRIMKAAKHAIESLAQHSGFILQDGANICPGTSIRNLRVMLTAVEKYGKYEDFGMHAYSSVNKSGRQQSLHSSLNSSP
jgi:uroporphyrinogen-III decarboxylase